METARYLKEERKPEPALTVAVEMLGLAEAKGQSYIDPEFLAELTRSLPILALYDGTDDPLNDAQRFKGLYDADERMVT